MIESRVARLRGHFEGDKQQYREKASKDGSGGEHKDPLTRFRTRLIAADHLTESEYEDRYAQHEATAREAVDFAQASEFPASEAAYEDVYDWPLYGQKGSDR